MLGCKSQCMMWNFLFFCLFVVFFFLLEFVFPSFNNRQSSSISLSLCFCFSVLSLLSFFITRKINTFFIIFAKRLTEIACETITQKKTTRRDSHRRNDPPSICSELNFCFISQTVALSVICLLVDLGKKNKRKKYNILIFFF